MDCIDLESPQKIQFHLMGGGNESYPLDLRASAEFLIYFQHIIDKSYCGITGKERLSPKSRDEYQLRIKSLSVGSLTADLILLFKGISLSLPLMGLANPKTIWDYACYALEYYKHRAEAKKDNIPSSINIETHGDSSPAMLVLNVGGNAYTYPPAVMEIARRSAPVYRKLSSAMERGQFESFHAHGLEGDKSFDISQSDMALFHASNIIQDETRRYSVNIIDFNKETMCGHLRILAGELCGNTFPFTLIGSQSPMKYIVGMSKEKVSVSALSEVASDGLGENKIIRLHLLKITTEESPPTA